MRIPWERLDEATLDNLVEEFVSREGTDYGHRDWSMTDKVEQVKRQLKAGSAVLVYDPDSQSCHIMDTEALDPHP